MFKLLKEYRFYVSIAILLLLPILALNTSKQEKSDFSFFDRTVLFVTAPVQEAITYAVDHAAHFLQRYIFVVNLNKTHAEVVEENRRLNNALHNFKEMEAESKRLRALLQLQERIPESKITAQVIAKDVSIEFKSIRINKGARAGIEKGMAVVTHEGVVGKILRTAPEYSDILTMLDDLSSIDAIVQRSRAHGLLEGMTDTACILKYVLRTDDIEAGDTIVTSGLDGIYPKGLMLGNVLKVAKKSYGITQTVVVRPSVDFSKLEEVLVILKQDKNIL
ncbi:MAG: rod shape-determining protein MreC [Deltaproteobacteria bacterium]|nr:rod shape-determining protein MreC [Deltaproteobacteria bacterium]